MNQKHISFLPEQLRRSWRYCRQRKRAVDELATCPPSELRRIAAEIGLSSEELYRLSLTPHGHAELLPRRLELLGIDAEYVRQAMPTTFRDLARVCAACPASRRCRQDLARGDAECGLESYCLNGPTIDGLIVSPDDRNARNA